jgi:saccharopine dehydrogenase (NADP+, L-glutamate forming)
MAALQKDANSAGVVLLNEVGLDPGIDHLFAHALVHDYKHSEAYSRDNRVYFRSYCGGVPAIPNKFKYKFSWSPFGVLKALTSPAQWIEHGSEQRIDTPWKAVTDYKLRTGKRKTEKFEAYPNRNSLPFINDYQFDDTWQVEQFVRGTLRLAGWSKAWASIFNEIESLSADNMTQRLSAISDELWAEHAYAPDEPDRVVLVVELEIHNTNDKVVWHQLRSVDDKGNADSTSMARLVSHTVALAVQSVLNGSFAPGVSAAPSDMHLVHQWLEELSALNDGFAHTIKV